MKPRKFRRMMLTGHRMRVLRETKGHAVPDRALKRMIHLEEGRRRIVWNYANGKGPRPARKPMEKK